MTSWIDVTGWTLVHFVWQGGAIALAAAIVLTVLRSASSQTRYAVACGALVLMVAAPAITALTLAGAPRTTLIDSVHLLRSPGGTVVGVAVVPPPSAQPASSAAAAAPIEFRLPAEVNTDVVFSAMVALWLTGVLILLTRLAAGCWRVRQVQAAARFEPASRWQSLADSLARRLRLRLRFSVVDSVRVVTPTVVGWLRPVVLLPVAGLSGLSTRQVEAILAHELAHIRRHDFIVNLMQTLAETALFYHPAVWWISRRIRAEREHCCDDVAVAVCGDAADYAAALTELASWNITQPTLAMAATRGPLLDRVRRLLRIPDSDRGPGRSLAVAVVLTCLVVVGLGAILRGQPIASSDDRGLGPSGINRMLGFNLFPGPVVLPGDDPLNVRAWDMTVGGEPAVTYVGFTGRSVIREAYGLRGMPIVGAPRWMDEETFDIAAPGPITLVDGRPDDAEVREVLQDFLEGPLGLRIHRERRTFPAYAMVRANPDGHLGTSLRPSTTDCIQAVPLDRPNGRAVDVGPVLRERSLTRRLCGIDNDFFGLTGTRVTMTNLAREFHRTQYPLAPDREIVDRTGLTGLYDFELRFGMLPLAAIGHANPALRIMLSPFGIRNVFSALPEQLGLKLVDTTISREVLVIDHIDRP